MLQTLIAREGKAQSSREGLEHGFDLMMGRTAVEGAQVNVGAGGLRGGRIGSRGDHRLAMLGAVAGLASREGVEVDGMEAADVSYPGFMDDMVRLM